MQLSELLVVRNRTGTKQGERINALCLAASCCHIWENAPVLHKSVISTWYNTNTLLWGNPGSRVKMRM